MVPSMDLVRNRQSVLDQLARDIAGGGAVPDVCDDCNEERMVVADFGEYKPRGAVLCADCLRKRITAAKERRE